MKNILIFVDGTEESKRGGDDGIVTNIAKMSDIAVQDSSQLVWYHAGVGAHKSGITKYLTRGLGIGLRQTVLEAYEFICENWESGDEIYVFGFSRGAYTVRSVVGMINAFGIIKGEFTDEMRNDIKDLYRIPPQFRKYYPHYSRIVAMTTERTRVKFVGVFDSVASLGLNFPGWVKDGVGKLVNVPGWILSAISFLSRICVGYHDTTLRNVDYAYQALAIDERRKPFKPAVWSEANDPRLVEVKQTWFSGVHANIGGGYEDVGLSDIAMQWLVNKAVAAGAKFNDYEYKPNIAGVMVSSHTGEWYYKVLGRIKREVAGAFVVDSIDTVEEPVVKEHVHEITLERYNRKLPMFNPKGYENAKLLPVDK